ncbi:hypothetical protein H6G33_09745 [Calothrix sp. FACHB-1219]|uniref:hypothetical protein n=1 Tax=unclassified Calothrix TaxID=2619626 RepID=UPI00168635C3|nr:MULTISPECIES: hypothetical protein [unclassified Calothrix]MBD2201629.1 hypothetical protein [Calothrix sp. FACHB-168]MBD2217315.1 hypothetical protein [Calothrix sp. FACHB-1219]
MSAYITKYNVKFDCWYITRKEDGKGPFAMSISKDVPKNILEMCISWESRNFLDAPVEIIQAVHAWNERHPSKSQAFVSGL